MQMKKIHILRYYGKLISSFRNSFTHTYLRSGAEDIHQLRVDIKKLRIILQLAERASNKRFNKKGHLKLFAPLFSMAGKVRELQINKELARQYDRNNRIGLISKLDSEIRYYTMKLECELSDFNFNKLSSLDKKLFAASRDLNDTMVINSSSKFIKGEVSKVIGTIGDDCQRGDLHSVRKRIRSVNETAGIMTRIDQGSFPAATLKDLKNLQEELGLWHDLVVFEGWLTEIRKEDGIVKEGPEFFDLQQKLILDINYSATVACTLLVKFEVVMRPIGIAD